jgi:hypothetical protein
VIEVTSGCSEADLRFPAARSLARQTEDMETTHRARRVTWPAVAAVVVALVYSWIASGLRAFTHPEAVAVSIPLIIAGVALLRARHRLDEDAKSGKPVTRRGTWVWVALVVVLLAWELISFRLSPRIDHPTLSSIADAIMSTHPGRFAMFAAWLGVGYWLFRR